MQYRTTDRPRIIAAMDENEFRAFLWQIMDERERARQSEVSPVKLVQKKDLRQLLARNKDGKKIPMSNATVGKVLDDLEVREVVPGKWDWNEIESLLERRKRVGAKGGAV